MNTKCETVFWVFNDWGSFFFFFKLTVRGSPRDLRVFDETVSTMKLAWQAAPGNVLQYRIAYKPSEGGERKEISVKGDTTQALLKNLQPATEYELFVSARYPSGVGDPLLGTGTTLEGKCVTVLFVFVGLQAKRVDSFKIRLMFVSHLCGNRKLPFCLGEFSGSSVQLPVTQCNHSPSL